MEPFGDKQQGKLPWAECFGVSDNGRFSLHSLMQKPQNKLIVKSLNNDRTLRYSTHTTNVKAKTSARNYVMKKLFNWNWGRLSCPATYYIVILTSYRVDHCVC